MLLDSESLKNLVPHRGYNLMPDRVELTENLTVSTSWTTIPPGDARGREVFARLGADGGSYWSEPFLAELMAITGVPLMHHILNPLGQVAVFSMISKITLSQMVPIGATVMGYAKVIRSRNGFTTFNTYAEADGVRFLDAEVMSGAAALGEIDGSAPRPFTSQLVTEALDPAWLAWKPSHLRFVDGIISADPDKGAMVLAYTYPVDHAFVPGHFPGGPLMMGVTQWSAVADAAWVAAKRFGIKGNILASGLIRRQDGSEVMNVRDLVLEVENDMPRIVSSKRIAFREPVRPTDGLIIDITVAPAPATVTVSPAVGVPATMA